MGVRSAESRSAAHLTGMNLQERGRTPGLPTNGGSFRASERAEPYLALIGPPGQAPFSEQIRVATAQVATAAKRVAAAETTLWKAERSPFGRKRGVRRAITTLAQAYRDQAEHERHLMALRRDLAAQEQRGLPR